MASGGDITKDILAGMIGSHGPEITRDVLVRLLQKSGYQNVRVDSTDPDLILAKHSERPSISLKIRKNLRIITLQHYWKLKKPGWGEEKKIAVAINQANNKSWLDIFSLDSAGDLSVSSYITLAENLTEDDIVFHLEQEARLFLQVALGSDLAQWMA